MADTKLCAEDRTMGVTALLALAAIRKLGAKATGLAIVELTGIDPVYIYNLLGRIQRRGYITITRTGVGSSKLYALTPDGERFINEVKQALK